MQCSGSNGDSIRLGVSSCLLGKSVRYNGGHKRDAFLAVVVGNYIDFIAYCPEVEGLQMSVPRQALELRKASGNPKLVVTATGADLTAKAEESARAKALWFRDQGLSGYVFKAKSPSCGVLRVNVWNEKNHPEKVGTGIFARILMEQLPLLPCEEEGRLQDPRIRFNFFERVFGYYRVTRLFGQRWTTNELIEFHTNEKMLLLAHSPELYEKMGRLVAKAALLPQQDVAGQYKTQFLEALAVQVSTGRHVNALQHVLGHLRDKLSPAAREDLASQIENYRKGLLPLVVPLVLMRHYVTLEQLPYLQRQTYLFWANTELLLKYAA